MRRFEAFCQILEADNEETAAMWNETIKPMMLVFVLPMMMLIACLTVLPSEFGIDPIAALRDGSKSLSFMTAFILAALGVLPMMAIMSGWRTNGAVANSVVAGAFLAGAIGVASIFSRLFV